MIKNQYLSKWGNIGLLLIFTSCLSPYLPACSTADSLPTIFQKLYSEGIEKVSICADFNELLSGRSTGLEVPGQFSFTDEAGEEIDLEVKISLRGKFRRKECDFPPLELDFKKKGLDEENIYRKNEEVKLVTHCLNSDEGEELVFKEYLAYKMYNKITDSSFRVHMIHVDYCQTPGQDTLPHKYAFLIENKKEMARRIGGQILDSFNLSLDNFNDKCYGGFVFFQYFIGNTDWDIQMLRNIEVVKTDAKCLLIPYDFDFSGLVNASYALPNPNVRQILVEQRVPMGYFTDRDFLRTTIREFKDYKKQFLSDIKAFCCLNKEAKKEMKRYVRGFYYYLSNYQQVEMDFLRE